MGRAAGQADVLAAHGLADPPVLVLGVDDVVLDAQHQRPQRLHLAGVGLARAALGEHHLVGVLQLAAEGVEDDQRVVVDAEAVEDAALHGEVAGGEGDHGGGAGGVQVAAAPQVVLARGQAGEEAGQHLVQGRAGGCQHPAQGRLHPAGEVVQGGQGGRPQAEVEAGREDPLLAPLEGVAQPLHVLVGHLPLGAGDLAAAGVQQPRRLQLHQLVGEAADGGRRLQRLQVEAQVQGLVEVDEAPQPVGVHVAGVLGQGEDPHVPAVHQQVSAGGLHGRRGDEVDDGPRTALEALLGTRRRSAVSPATPVAKAGQALALTPSRAPPYHHRLGRCHCGPSRRRLGAQERSTRAPPAHRCRAGGSLRRTRPDPERSPGSGT